MSTTTADPGGRGIPGHWQQVSLRSLLRPRSERNRIDLPLLSVLRSAGVIPRNRNKAENHNFIPDDLSSYKAVRQGDFVINKMKAWSGSVGVAPMDGIVSPAYFVYEFLADVDVRYMNQLLRGPEMRDAFARVSRGIRVGQWDLNPQDIKDILVSFPPLEEQRLIVRYLDNAELRIAQAIAGKKSMLLLLEERESRAILDAITSCDRQRKSDSRLDWLGEFPAHWDVKRLGAVLEERREMNADRKVQQVLSLVRKRGVMRYEDKGRIGNKRSEDVARYKVVREGDIVLNSMNVIIGSVGLSKIDGCLSPVYYVLRAVNRHHSTAFFSALFQIERFHTSLIRHGKGILAHRMRIPWIELKSVMLPVPPADEQAGIAQRVEEVVSAFKDSYVAIENEIALLLEYRTKLISDVVTGKLDVREEAAKMSDVDPVELAAVLAGGSMKSNTEEDDDNADN